MARGRVMDYRGRRLECALGVRLWTCRRIVNHRRHISDISETCVNDSATLRRCYGAGWVPGIGVARLLRRPVAKPETAALSWRQTLEPGVAPSAIRRRLRVTSPVDPHVDLRVYPPASWPRL